MRVAVYPGTYDPFHNGHLDIALRAAKLFDRLIIAVYEYPVKDVLFTAEERLELARRSVKSIANIDVECFSGLTVEYARSKNACAIMRGLRGISDFEFEFEIAHMNRKLNPR